MIFAKNFFRRIAHPKEVDTQVGLTHLPRVKIIKCDEYGEPGGDAGVLSAARNPIHVHHHIQVLVTH